MTKSKKTIALATATVLGLASLATNVDAQNRYSRTYGNYNQPTCPTSLTQQINQKVRLIDDLADQMACRYGREVRYYRGCECSMKLLQAMRAHTQLTESLLRASAGSCPCTFKKAACAVRTNLDLIQRRARTAQVSCTVKSMINQSCPPTTFVHRNADKWTPSATRNRGYRDSYTHYSQSDRPLLRYVFQRFGL